MWLGCCCCCWCGGGLCFSLSFCLTVVLGAWCWLCGGACLLACFASCLLASQPASQQQRKRKNEFFCVDCSSRQSRLRLAWCAAVLRLRKVFNVEEVNLLTAWAGACRGLLCSKPRVLSARLLNYCVLVGFSVRAMRARLPTVY